MDLRNKRERYGNYPENIVKDNFHGDSSDSQRSHEMITYILDLEKSIAREKYIQFLSVINFVLIMALILDNIAFNKHTMATIRTICYSMKDQFTV